MQGPSIPTGADAASPSEQASRAEPASGGGPGAGPDDVARAGLAVAWLPWDTDAFLRAHRLRRPVLLSIVARWAPACRAMDGEVFADPRVAALIAARTVPIRVDADRRPDIAERYDAGGWPTTLLLTAEGDPLTGGTYVEADRLLAAISSAADRCAADPDGLRRLAQQARRARQASAARAPVDDTHEHTLAWIRGCLIDAYDREHAGFGRAGKFPLAAPVAFALHAGARTGDAELLAVATRTLDRMGWGGLSASPRTSMPPPPATGAATPGLLEPGATPATSCLPGSRASDVALSGDAPVPSEDATPGAFHRACGQRDWTAPDRAHLLDVQADMLRLYLDAWAITGVERYRERARGIWDYVDRVLHDRDAGGFFTSEVDGDIHRVLLTDANAKMIRALLQASLAFDEVAMAQAAVRAAERLLPAVYERAAGVAHLLVDSRAHVRGLLGDQVHASAAALDLYDHTADRVYLDLADELMRACVRKLWDTSAGAAAASIETDTAVAPAPERAGAAEARMPPAGSGASTPEPADAMLTATAGHRPAGALRDRLRSRAGAGDVGLLGDPLWPFALNAEAARVLGRLGRETQHPEFLARAADLHAWLAAAYRQHDILSADYGLLVLGSMTP